MSRLKTTNQYRKCSRYDYDAPGYESESDSSEEENEFYSDSEPSLPPTQPIRVNERWREHRANHPACGIPARNRLRSHVIDTYSSTTYSSNLSSTFETTNDTNETDPSDLYTPIDRSHRSPSRHVRAVIMEEEISPVPHAPDHFIPPLPPSLRLHREWRPQQTSTTTSLLQPVFAVPKMGSGSGLISSTPRSSSRRRVPLVTSYNQVLNMKTTKDRARPKSYYDTEDLARNVWDNTRSASTRSLNDNVNSGFFRPENFGLHAAYAKNKDTKGILFLTMTLTGTILTVNVNRAVYFLESCQPQICSYVKLELRNRSQSERKRQQSSSRSRPREAPTQGFRTDLVPTSNKPEFRSTFNFDLDCLSHGAVLFICVWAMSAEHSSFSTTKKRMLGCMSFPISRLFKKARASGHFYEDENMSMDQVVVNDGGFFLLDEKRGGQTNMPQNKIKKAEYYDDPALCGSSGLTAESYSSSNLTSGAKMPMEEFVAASRNFGSSLVPGYSSMGDVRQMDYTSASSSTNSRDPSYPYHGMHRATLPSITTTSDTTSERDDFSGFGTLPHRPDQHHLFVDSDQNDRRNHLRDSVRGPSPKKEVSVRRAASFTFSPKGTVDKHNKRTTNGKEKDEDKEKRKLFGPISKTISYIRNKMDTALSTSSLYPSKEDVRQWETCFEALLNHKFGCSLFRQFLKKEFSDENVDFWLECEEFKRMKDGKKTTNQRAHDIYREFVAEQSPKEVNLDSDTRAATKAALESGCKTDTFSLAQSRIEQLMEKDSYRRFLKDPLYQDLLKSTENGENAPDSTS